MKFNPLIPELYVSHFNKSLTFYTALGFKIEYEREKPKFAFLSYQGSQLMIQEYEPEWVKGKLEYPYGRGMNLQIHTSNINSVYQSLLNMNYHIHNKIEKNSYKVKEKIIISKELIIMDPDGYLLRFSQDIDEETTK
jgi:catechol 2,3-dioxygenase-like lactoylglutathione lyase family enzyme